MFYWEKWQFVDCKYLYLVRVEVWAIPRAMQGLYLALCSSVISGGVWGTICDARDSIQSHSHLSQVHARQIPFYLSLSLALILKPGMCLIYNIQKARGFIQSMAPSAGGTPCKQMGNNSRAWTLLVGPFPKTQIKTKQNKHIKIKNKSNINIVFLWNR